MNANLIDPARWMYLDDVGLPEYLAATAISTDGGEHLVLVECESIGDETVRYDFTCADVVHEQLGALPPRWSARITLAPLRCGRPTKTTGRPCRIEVTRRGEPCGLHRRQAALDLLADQ